ncbi:L,D-transpeptidase [Serpentinicella alkaliphila]|uniref:L,D-transpeptidase-like protein n=1 Tax=Serpentinicella alkaliphila TaxID=1734049 RepID=A0A4V2T3M2_9FIRM|nr:L,D-transpeptidase [Serpentinicella alkaliphila]QUH25889.1 L,D-transpeptidase [Serpentinicella alkaliphila]TCQ01954.1 L,D-transpeptidase-like protein [Serpentinicella alkaliphila]
MYKKSILILIFIITLTTYGCANRREMPREQSPGQRVEQQREDRLAKSDQEAVEENINGYNLQDDLKITREEGSEISYINQEQKDELINGLGPKENNTILEEFRSSLPVGINNAIDYFKYNISFDYFLITAEEGSTIRETPTDESAAVTAKESLEKVSLLHRVEGEELEGSNIWYRVAFENQGSVNEGYIHSSMGTPRNFRFDSMKQAIDELNEQLGQGPLHFISNYKNENGTPPQRGDAAIDEFGYRVYHSAPAYDEANTESNYRYIPDGMLVRILDETGDFYHIDAPTFGRGYYVPKQYIDPNVTLRELTHVVVIDRSQQNQGAFEVEDNGLNLVSYTFSTTGIPGEFSYETTLGSYKAIQKRDRFEYLKSGTQEIAGYAPFAIRFTGGAYIHGVPVAYEEVEGEMVDPGFIEYLHTIGTFPRSNMCVRNFTSHAEFLYNWMNVRNGAVIVIE